MACQFDVLLNAGEHAGSTEAAIEALDLIETLEAQLTVYRDSSEVSQLNRNGFTELVVVEPQLFELIQRSVSLFHATNGAFDITSGPLIQLWDKLRTNGEMPKPQRIKEVLQLVDSNLIQLDPLNHTVRLSVAGVSIDFGGIGKGYALDRCADFMTTVGIESFLVHGGSSSILARGTRLSGTTDEGWTVGIRHPLRADRRLLELQLCHRAVGTSGAGTKQFYHQGKRYGHVIDPRTGYPSDGVLSTTVVAPSAATADALSTAFYVLGVDAAAEYCQAYSEVSAIITTLGPSGSVEVHRINCDDLSIAAICP